MKKNFYIVAATLLLSTSAFAKCGSISLGFVTVITGTYLEEVFVGYDQNLQPMYELQEVKCSAGDRWQWFWE
ncbi:MULTISPECIES: hypothetical protein [Flavobacterium]|uniref:hypothetical protein n=1 Tax=Flavobacterium TaxID=237 RepID=UPI001FCBFB63|nr:MULTISPECIES: hypothetical protein [Flavobacterium]UOK43660.1 hypothetical protein LZF87_05960 [Flavobacterium enshiense]